MYNVLSKQIILEIPKAGSRSLVQAVTLAWGKKAIKCAGHATLTELLDDRIPNQVKKERQPKKPYSVIGVVRCPVTRMHSMINEYKNIKACTLDEAMKACVEQSHIIFKPQNKFLMYYGESHIDANYIVYPLENITEALMVVGKGKRFTNMRVNDGRGRRTINSYDIENHDLYPEAMQHYSVDKQIHSALQRTGGGICTFL